MFSWDPAKAEQNLRKHGISFADATEAFADLSAVDSLDIKHSQFEQRRLLIGTLSNGRVVTVSYTWRTSDEGKTTRVISARPANSRERMAREHKGSSNR